MAKLSSDLNSNGCESDEGVLKRSIERVAGDILPKSDKPTVNTHGAQNPRNSLLYSVAKQAVEAQVKLLEWNADTIEALEIALRNAKATRDLINNDIRSKRHAFELALDSLGIEVNDEEDAILGYGKE